MVGNLHDGDPLPGPLILQAEPHFTQAAVKVLHIYLIIIIIIVVMIIRITIPAAAVAVPLSPKSSMSTFSSSSRSSLLLSSSSSFYPPPPPHHPYHPHSPVVGNLHDGDSLPGSLSFRLTPISLRFVCWLLNVPATC